jgi:hypothetical protein
MLFPVLFYSVFETPLPRNAQTCAQPGNVMRFPSHGLHASSITRTQGSKNAAFEEPKKKLVFFVFVF